MKTDLINVVDTETLIYLQQTYSQLEYSISASKKKLLYKNNQLSLLTDSKKIYIDFSDNDIASRINPKLKKCSVVQAVEGRKKDKMLILDSTAGLGRDSFTLAARGHNVVSIEKDPYIFLLLKNALERAKQIEDLKNIADKITLINQDANDYIKNNSSLIFDCIYIDPMFPERKKSAKVKQNMQIMHDIAFIDEKGNSLLVENSIQSQKTKKLVIKRPVNAEFLSAKAPSSQIKGKSNRFDIYSI
ncbi:16S rRNA methyltransferase [Francisella sp. Scap27]|nr:class I SAM-dependent methyltransferase [Francisella sp. Scap27]QLE78679.1 16S rRNA methyltransferase [Francisella sp. Scap27]